MVIKDEGGWHVRFHQVTEAQAKELAEWKKAKKSSPAKDCGEHAGELCMDVEMRRPGIGTLAAAQKYAKEIGCYNLTLNVWSCNESAQKFYEKQGLKPQKTTMEMIL